MRWLLPLLLVALCLPGFASAQDTRPVIAVTPFLRQQDIYTLRQGEAPDLLVEADTPLLVLSPDGQQVAVLDYPAFVQDESELEPGEYPRDLLVIAVSSGEQKHLLTHERETTSTTGDQFYSGDFVGGVNTSRAWDDPNAIFGGRLTAFLAWSPDSQQIAQVQTVVSDGQYPGKSRLVVFDVASGDMAMTAELGRPGPGYAVFWFDAGIVLYTDPPEGGDTVTVYAPDGDVLYQWEVGARILAHENPVRYEGRDYLAFPQWSLYDVATGDFMPVEGTIARVSASNPAQSLALEACDDRDELRPTWDIYSADGDHLANLRHVSTPTLSPDGSQGVYVDYDSGRVVTVFDGDASIPLTGSSFAAESVLWGAAIYTITSVGAADCHRTARG